jgi:hypothetical protein
MGRKDFLKRKEEKRRAVPSVVPKALMTEVLKVREASVLSALVIVLLVAERKRKRGEKKEEKVKRVRFPAKRRDERVKDRKRRAEKVAKSKSSKISGKTFYSID